jgi:hypothetical protein
MDNTTSSEMIIANLNRNVDTLINKILWVKNDLVGLPVSITAPVIESHTTDRGSRTKLRNGCHQKSAANTQTESVITGTERLEALEKELQQITKELADTIAGIKLQQHLDSEANKAAEKELAKSQPMKMKDMGSRIVKIRMLGGTIIAILVTYYHRKATIKKHQSRRGFYPGLLLVGITNRYSPGLESLSSLLATATCSFAEASQLIQEALGFKIDVKTIRLIAKRFAERARSSVELDKIERPNDFAGRIVAASTDGGRIRIRKNKRGKKTKKGRTRYKTDWREPKLIIIYVVDQDGQKDRKILPVMDATLNGPDETFALLIYYLKKLNVNSADLLLFVSDGAKWIWERAKNLAKNVGICATRCLFALDYYHAAEHLSALATAKQLDKKQRDKWIKQQKERLLNGNLEKFMDEITIICKGSKNVLVKREYAYFKKHLPHMKYAELRSKGLPIGSGAVESGIRRVVNLRLKGPGIFWHEDSADAMLMLRSYYKAGRWNMLKNMSHAGLLAA